MKKPSFKGLSALLILAATMLSSVNAQFAPRNQGESYLAIEEHSGKVMYALNANAMRPVASLTKVAAAIVVLDWAEITGTKLATRAVVPASALALGGPNPMNLQAGEQVSLRDLLYSALLGSDNVAAETLAHHVGSSMLRAKGRYGDPVPEFVSEMNRLARSLGMTRTAYQDPHGLGAGRRVSKSTAIDQALLAMHSTKNEAFTFMVRQPTRKVEVYGPTGVRSFNIGNTNKLLGKMGVVGLKTGTTNAAGQCYIGHAEKPNLVRKDAAGQTLITPRGMIVVVLGSRDRYTRAEQLLNNSWAQFDQWAAQGFPSTGARGEYLRLKANNQGR